VQRFLALRPMMCVLELRPFLEEVALRTQIEVDFDARRVSRVLAVFAAAVVVRDRNWQGASELLVMIVRAFRGHFSAEHHHGVELAGIYWHFVDVMWIIVYFTVYIL